MPEPVINPTALTVLQDTFGYDSFRGPQKEIIDVLIDGGDALVLMPTGGGKSLCYQIPALVREGCGVVISPLIALMQNQVEALRLNGVRAEFLNSTLDARRVAEIESDLLAGEIDLLYIAPERLNQPRTLSLLQDAKIGLFAIDEAHCVSQWGHDFRPDYIQLNILHEVFPNIPRVALTATADARTQAEIVSKLELGGARQFIAGFDRPNIRYKIALKHNPKTQLLKFLQAEHENHAGIVYCLSRKKTEQTAEWLTEKGYKALPYHAGLDSDVRAKHQSRFLKEEGVIIVATIAFGMGIDKPDVRFVVHLDLPKTLEAYYQETGRAGRDGEPANAWMVYGLQDVAKLGQMMDNSEGSEEFKRLERLKLNAMLGFCEITTCRRHALLAYFDEDSKASCGNCDTCLNPPETWDGSLSVQKALSAVYRTGQRFGVNHLTDVLRGVENDRVIQYDHHKLGVFGVGKDLGSEEWKSVYRQLLARDFIRADADKFGAIILEEKCRGLLRGEETIQLRRDIIDKSSKSTAKKLTKTPLPDDIDVTLWEALRETRRTLAEEQGVPPYVIFHDKTLQAMAEDMPANLDAFSKLPGVGDRKRDKYGETFLKIING